MLCRPVIPAPGGGGGGSSTYTGLTDTPANFTGSKGKYPRVNSGETAIEFVGIEYPVEVYGAVGDGIKIDDANITASSTTLTSAAGLFTSGDVGKPIYVAKAGAAAATLMTTIASYTSATQVELTDAAGTTVTNGNAGYGTDDTSAIQGAINAANTAGSGKVVLGHKNYFTTGRLYLKKNVTLGSHQTGPFSGMGDFKDTIFGPTIYVTNESGDFITFNSVGEYSVSVEDIIFAYPLQDNWDDTIAPIQYPWTISFQQQTGGNTGTTVRRCTLINAYDGIDFHNGQGFFENLYIGALNRSLLIDHCADIVFFNQIHCWPFYLWMGGGAGHFKSALDVWVQNNAVAFTVHRADQLFVNGFFCLAKNVGIKFVNSPDTGQAFLAGYGNFTGINLDMCVNGVQAINTHPNSLPVQFNGLGIGGDPSTGVTGMEVSAGARVEWTGGGFWGQWSTGRIVNNGELRYCNLGSYGDLMHPTGSMADLDLEGRLKVGDDSQTPAGGHIRYVAGSDSYQGYNAAAGIWQTFGAGDIDGGLYSDTYISTGDVDGGAFI